MKSPLSDAEGGKAASAAQDERLRALLTPKAQTGVCNPRIRSHLEFLTSAADGTSLRSALRAGGVCMGYLPQLRAAQ